MIRFFYIFLLFSLSSAFAQTYSWGASDSADTIHTRFTVPEGFQRVVAAKGTFAHWLRHLPLKKGRPPVMLHDGRLKGNQNAHVAVIDIDPGKRDLQQCADAVMRLRAEYLYANKQFTAIHFNYTSGDKISFLRWAAGERPVVNGNSVRWKTNGVLGKDYANFRNYLKNVFTYAGTYSLRKEMKVVKRVNDMQVGDVFIQGGFPGHAVIVVDVAVHRQTGEKQFLLAQSFMPAQDIHVLQNPLSSSPWYSSDFGSVLKTAEWTFGKDDLRRFD
ncbi:MAG: DUF4846 domain-containing protein [Calditrichia bacterium]